MLFTVLVWLLFLLIYLGNRHNKLNFWCFLSGMCFSMGVLKEYLYFTLFPELMEAYPQMLSGQKALAIYSVLTAALYYLAMPAALVFGMYFCRLHEQRPKLFYWARMLVFLPALAFGLYYPYIQTRCFQLCDRSYFWTVSVYNIAYGVLLTGFAVAGVTEHQDQKIRRQKMMVAGLGLIPIWYWLVTVFLCHLLGVTSHFKAWQGNLIVILLLIAVYLYNAFQDGFMGIRLRHESYDWNAVNESLFNRSAHYLQHTVKHEMAKIEWCAKNIRQSTPGEEERYVEIILRSTGHLREFMTKTVACSSDIVLHKKRCRVRTIIEECCGDVNRLCPKVLFHISCKEEEQLFCDREHLSEVLRNLFQNAVDAMDQEGAVSVRFIRLKRRHGSLLMVTDIGRGVPGEVLTRIFDPYFTMKETDGHMGLGLCYCRTVMRLHGGDIAVSSKENAGTTFTLHFPPERMTQIVSIWERKRNE